MPWQRLERFAAHSWSMIVPGVAGAVLRLALLPWLSFPIPNAQDEFSYLLGADTFLHGRLTNPAHPLWRFFETIHVISIPTYASKYPPGQAFFLAIGQRLFGHPFFGNVIAYALMITALVWMLRAWAPPAVALLAGCGAALIFGPGHSWIESYWGGTVSTIGAALVLGAVGRMRSEGRFGHAWSLAAGSILLWFTRPYEGFCFLVAAMVVLLVDARRRHFRGVVPPLLILAGCATATLAFQAHYDRRITGNRFLLPYLLHQRQYDYMPSLWIQAPLTPTLDANPHVRDIHRIEELGTYRDRRHEMIGWLTHEPDSGRGLAPEMKDRLKMWECVFILVALTGFVIPNRRDPEVKVLSVIALVSIAALALETTVLDHYMGPLVVVLFALGARVFWLTWPRHPIRVAAFVALVLMIGLGNNAFRARRAIRHAIPFPANRSRIEQALAARDGRHVVLVRYAPQKGGVVTVEWVHNGADIDAQQVIWAHDLGPAADQQLVAYYPGRHFWMLDVDADRPEPVPYTN